MATTTTGEDVDMDGYTVLVDGASGQAIGANGILTIPGLAAGDREVELTDVASNCTVAGQNPRMVAVTRRDGPDRLRSDLRGDHPSPPLVGKIAFSSNRDGYSEIFVMNADGSEPTNVSSSPGSNDIAGWPQAWSPQEALP